MRITRAAPGGSTLRAGKGINVPDTRLDIGVVLKIETAQAFRNLPQLC
ncbi:MAG: hypothetical protein LH603_12990 [Pseudonocardia sp.]|nr:hypothetical protein [Pseudonocardia sp.]